MSLPVFDVEYAAELAQPSEMNETSGYGVKKAENPDLTKWNGYTNKHYD